MHKVHFSMDSAGLASGRDVRLPAKMIVRQGGGGWCQKLQLIVFGASIQILMQPGAHLVA